MIYLAADLASIKATRDYVGKIAAEGWPIDEYTVRVVVSELVTNAIRHAGTAVRVDAYADGDAYVVEVWDGDGTLPVVCPSGPDSLGGRGLVIVGDLVSRWGTLPDDEEGGKVVFAEWRAP